MNALLKVLRYENVVVDESNKNFTMQSLYKYLRENSNDNYEKLKLYVYQWSLGLIKGDEEIVLQQMQKKIPGFLKIFGKAMQNSEDFICRTPETVPNQAKGQECINKCEGVDSIIDMIGVTTIHAEKGQDHTATLYLETYYDQDGKGENAKSYESERLCEQLKFNPLPSDENRSRTRQSAKMMYVGCSRPTHLLCIAVQKENFDRYLSDIDQEKWEIIYI
jgi:hypothetical protein